MTRTRILTGGLFAALLFVLSGAPASAQVDFNPPEPRIAIVDVQAILRESLSAKSVREQMEKIGREEQAVLAEEEKKLRAEDQELQQQRSLLTPEVFTQRQQKLQADVANLQRKSRNLRLALDQSFQRSMDQIQLILFDELRKLSTELDLNLIVPRSQIVIAVDDFDITKPALERLDKRLPSVELKLQKTENSDQKQ